MADRPHPLVRSARAAEMEMRFSHPLNPKSRVRMRPLARVAGLARTGVSHVTVPPGHESFVYHSHESEEEWLYILSGSGIAEIDGEEHEVRAGDFMGFPTPSVGHHLRNDSAEPLVYLMGGENHPVEVAHFPNQKKCLVRSGLRAELVDADQLTDFTPKFE